MKLTQMLLLLEQLLLMLLLLLPLFLPPFLRWSQQWQQLEQQLQQQQHLCLKKNLFDPEQKIDVQKLKFFFVQTVPCTKK